MVQSALVWREQVCFPCFLPLQVVSLTHWPQLHVFCACSGILLLLLFLQLFTFCLLLSLEQPLLILRVIGQLVALIGCHHIAAQFRAVGFSDMFLPRGNNLQIFIELQYCFLDGDLLFLRCSWHHPRQLLPCSIYMLVNYNIKQKLLLILFLLKLV